MCFPWCLPCDIKHAATSCRRFFIGLVIKSCVGWMWKTIQQTQIHIPKQHTYWICSVNWLTIAKLTFFSINNLQNLCSIIVVCYANNKSWYWTMEMDRMNLNRPKAKNLLHPFSSRLTKHTYTIHSYDTRITTNEHVNGTKGYLHHALLYNSFVEIAWKKSILF